MYCDEIKRDNVSKASTAHEDNISDIAVCMYVCRYTPATSTCFTQQKTEWRDSKTRTISPATVKSAKPNPRCVSVFVMYLFKPLS